MSYILDALKKLEHEKAKKSRGAGMSCISGDLFRDENRYVGSSRWKLIIVVVVASLATSGVTWFVLRGDKGIKAREPVRSVSVVAPVVSKPVVPALSSARQGGVTAPPPAAVVQATVPPPVARLAPPPPIARPVLPPVGTATRPRQAVSSAPIVERVQTKKQKRPVVSEQDDQQLTTPPADMKISGIAWQDERRARRAVVNGFLLHEGSAVSGATITEIFQDRVRFSQSGRIFEIPLISSGMPAVQK